MNISSSQVESIVRKILGEITPASSASSAKVPATAKVAMLTAPKTIEVKEFPMPTVGDNDILVKVEDNSTSDEKSAAFEKILAIKERIAAGGNFAEEAEKNSDCPSGREGGSLGWFGPGMMVPEFDKVAFEMKKGEVSGVVTTQFGYHIETLFAHTIGACTDNKSSHIGGT